MNTDPRYPYTYACDLIRMCSDASALSRSNASQIMRMVSTVLGMDNEELACKLADYYKANETVLVDEAVSKFAAKLEESK